MGWWKVKATEHQLGDAPLDVLGQAVSAVVAEYQRELGRNPTKPRGEAREVMFSR